MSWASRHNLLARAVNRNLGGVSVIWGAVTGEAILEENAQLVADGNVISVEYMLHNLPTAQFGNLLYGDEVTVAGIVYQVRENMRIGDGAYCAVSLQRLDPGSSAVGRNPREGLRLDDLTDVTIQDPQSGEVLEYDGTKWVDSQGSITTAAFVFTQSTPASTWTIAHNLGFRPSVELISSAGQEIDADVTHTSANVCVVTFNQPVAGLARLN